MSASPTETSASVSGKESAISATYSSPDSSSAATFKYPLPTSVLAISSMADKTSYLDTLRTAVVRLQEDVNVFLTRKMDDDKTARPDQDRQSEKLEQDENEYGEEGVDDAA